MRLIDADKLLEKISYQFVHSDGRIDFDEVKYNIFTQPTAYKVDKVMEQLDELVTINMEVLNTRADWVQLEQVKKLIKRGGIDENKENN